MSNQRLEVPEGRLYPCQRLISEFKFEDISEWNIEELPYIFKRNFSMSLHPLYIAFHSSGLILCGLNNDIRKFWQSFVVRFNVSTFDELNNLCLYFDLIGREDTTKPLILPRDGVMDYTYQPASSCRHPYREERTFPLV